MDRSLLIGGLIILLISLLAISGPLLAPRDPLQENFVVFIDSHSFVKPPFPAFAVPGFPLGSDEYGRDVFSRLLWAIKPTLTMVLVVASIRLLLGTLLGIIAGWSGRWLGRAIDSFITFALSVPVLFIALFVIAASAQKLGLWAFIIGLILTGWTDAARLVREQTRQVRSQLYIEASAALGSSTPQTIFRHILPQVIPLVWISLAFEISSTMLVTAELGVLGYFINAIWIPIGDWVGIRASGAPDLGEMLSSLLRQPWGALSAGVVVFITILGFNLLGNGLRNMSSTQNRTRRTQNTITTAADWVEEQVYHPLSGLRLQLPTVIALVFLVVLAVGGGILLWQSQVRPPDVEAYSLPVNNLWATTNRDSQGSKYSPVNELSTAKVAWTYNIPSGFSGGPVVSADGTLYLAALDDKLYAVSPEGTLLWTSLLPVQPVGSPALGPSGNIYIVDITGGLTTVFPDGQVIETLRSNQKTPALTGPVVASDESVYYVTTEDMIAVGPDGQIKWREPLPTYSITSPNPRLSPDERYFIFEDYLVDTATGDLAVDSSPDPLDKIVIGLDRKMYRISLSSLTEVSPSPAAGEKPRIIKWDARSLGTSFRYPNDGGTFIDGKIWIGFGNEYENTRLVWLDPSGALISSVDYPFPGYMSRIAAVDRSGTFYVCGTFAPGANPDQTHAPAECRANRLGDTVPLWRLALPAEGIPTGAALIEGKLYVAMSSTTLFCITEK